MDETFLYAEIEVLKSEMYEMRLYLEM